MLSEFDAKRKLQAYLCCEGFILMNAHIYFNGYTFMCILVVKDIIKSIRTIDYFSESYHFNGPQRRSTFQNVICNIFLPLHLRKRARRPFIAFRWIHCIHTPPFHSAVRFVRIVLFWMDSLKFIINGT